MGATRLQFSLARLVILIGICAAAAQADTIQTYDINFTGGSPNPTGQFTYDVTMNVFTAFTVTWDGIIFDLTTSANTPFTQGDCPTSDPQASFQFLTSGKCGTSAIGQDWHTDAVPSPFFEVYGIGSDTFVNMAFGTFDVGPGNFTVNENGTFTTTLVPEPSSAILVLSALLPIAILTRKRFARGSDFSTRMNRLAARKPARS